MYEWSLSLLLYLFGISVARNMDGLLCKSSIAPGHKGNAKAYRELNGMESLEWPAESPDLNLMEAGWRCGDGVGRDMETSSGR